MPGPQGATGGVMARTFAEAVLRLVSGVAGLAAASTVRGLRRSALLGGLLVPALGMSAACGQSAPNAAPGGQGAARPAAGASGSTIEIVAGARRWTARIADTPAGRDFLGQLPLDVTLREYGGNQMIADLPRALTRDGAPDAATPRAGDIAFYAPWGNLAIFYGDGRHSPGLIPLGRIEAGGSIREGAGLRVTIRRAQHSARR